MGQAKVQKKIPSPECHFDTERHCVTAIGAPRWRCSQSCAPAAGRRRLEGVLQMRGRALPTLSLTLGPSPGGRGMKRRRAPPF